jgi:hypothetical protein
METIIIKGTTRTPAIKFDTNGKLEIKGRSIPENAVEFYRPLMESLGQYPANSASLLQADIKLEYFNTDSARCLLKVFRALEAIHSKGAQVVINWYYEKDDTDMQEAGADYKAIVNLTFNLEKVEMF